MKRYFSFGTLAGVLAAAVLLLTSCTLQTTVALLSPGQKKYVGMPRKERIAYFADKQCRKEMKDCGYYPQTFKIPTQGVKSITFTELTDLNARSKTLKGAIKITAPAYVLIEQTKEAVSFGNLKIAKSYQWKCDNGKEGVFSTEDIAPRLLKINGVPNVRDLGGRRTMEGNRVKQGLVYRTAGLNDNASHARRPLTQAQLDANGGFLRKLKAKLEARIKRAKAQLKRGAKEPVLVPYTLANSWSVYLCDHKLAAADYQKLAALKTLPDSLFGGKAFTMKGDAKGKMKFPQPKVGHFAVFAQIFDSPADGLMQIGTGADWYYAVYVNGECYLNLLRAGNGKNAREADDNIINIPVKKGKNIIVIPVESGNDTWALAVGKPSKALSYKAILEQEIKAANETLYEEMSVATPQYKKGRNRLNAAAKAYVVNDLGVRSDIDLRSDRECWGMKGSPAGNKVTWFHYSSASYKGMQGKAGREAFIKVFEVFLDEKNYPIVFHCIAGQDRTGAVAFIINALLGVPEEELFLDWEVTGFWNGSEQFNHVNRFNKLYDGFNQYPGKTINERVEKYVLSLGFTQADIAKLRKIMLEK